MTAASDRQPGEDILTPYLERIEKLFVLCLFGVMVERVVHSVWAGANSYSLLQLLSEGLAVALVLLRRPASTFSTKPMDWLFALGATAGPLLVKPGGHGPLGPVAVAAGLMLIGLAGQVAGKMALGRCFGVVPANRGLAISGPYGVVRHPIYLGYLIGQIGFLLLNPTAWNAGVYGVSLVLQLCRIEAEERLLAQDHDHAAFRAAVPYRLIPGVY